jgi:cholesterol oxidase
VSQPEHVEVVVVGSGFGGSVAAYRLAEAGRRVCVLERGKAYPPGSFPRKPHEMRTNFWDPSLGLQGLFNLWSFRGIEALVSSGLGGGSLIYANVLIRKDERWFVEESPFGSGYEHWPITRADLEPHYDRVERMLGGNPFPFGEPGYDLPKTAEMRAAAARAGLEWQLPQLAISFATGDSRPAPDQPLADGAYANLHGVGRWTCRLCGECDLGCNYGSKNTLDHTYLSAAQAAGAELRTRAEVRRIAPRQGGGYEVHYIQHLPENEGHRTTTSQLAEVTVTCDRLILAAGAIGTPYLLLRNRSAFPHISPALGTRFCGNGDLLGFALPHKGRRRRDREPPLLDSSHGPVITSAVRVPDAADGGSGRGYYIEDAGYPHFIDWMLEARAAPSTIGRLARFAARRAWARLTGDPQSDLSAEMGEVLGHAELSSTSLPLLGMGRDIPDGVMRLRRGHLDVDWTVETSRPFFEAMRRTMTTIADELGGRLVDNPLWRLGRMITVHPLGGAPMGRHAEEGVVDSSGEVFTYPGLHVVDGAAMPGPVGPNPALTIAAFADRAAERIIESERTRVPVGKETG